VLKRVTVHNWRAFDAAEVPFRPGLNILLGPNGAGKTSVLEAVSFGLTGELFTLSDARLMVRHEGRPVDVAVSLDLDGQDWEVCRALGPRQRRGQDLLRRAGATAAEGGERVAAEIERLLGMPADFFLRILYMPEGDVYRFLTNPPLTAVETHLRRLLGLEQLALVEQAAARVKREVARQETKLTGLAEQVAQRDSVLTAGRARWSGDLNQRRGELEADCQRLTAARAETRERRRRAEVAVHAAERALQELAALDREHAALAQAADPQVDLAALRARAAELQLDVQKLDATLAEVSAERKALTESTRSLAARPPADLVADDPAQRAQRAQFEASIREVDAAVAAAEAERQALADSTQFLESHAPGGAAASVCPVCRQPLPEALRQRLLAENAARHAALGERIADLRHQRESHEAALQAQAQALRGRVLEERAQRDRALAQQATELRGRRQALAAELEDAERREGDEVNRRRRLDDLAQRRQALVRDDTPPQELQAQLAHLQEEQTAARDQEQALETEYEARREELASLQGYLQLAALEARTPADLERARAAFARRELLADLFAAATAETLQRLRASALAEAYDEVARAWEQFSGWADVRLEPQAKGRLSVHRTERSLDLAQLSGGERAAFLALLHAHLGRHFGRGGFLLLDEPLEHLDSGNGRRLLEHLKRACADGLLTQVILATVEAEVVHSVIRDGDAHIVALPLTPT
jgi:exonuclease SbcC